MSTSQDAPPRFDRPSLAGPPNAGLATVENSSAGPHGRVDSAHLAPPPPAHGPEQDQHGFASDEDLLIQASRIAEGLRSRSSELERRERTVTEQLAAIDAERRNFRLMVEETRNEIEERLGDTDRREAEAADRLASCDRVAAELDEAGRRLRADRETLDHDRESYRDDLDHELAERSAILARETATLEEARRRLAAEAEELRSQRARELEERGRRLEADRITLREQLGSELEAERIAFEAERTEWENARLEQIADIERERSLNDTAIRRAHEVIEQARADQRREADEARAALEGEITRRHEEAASDGEEERARVREELRVEASRIRFQREHLERIRNECEHEQARHAHERQRFVQLREHEHGLLRLRRVQLDHYRQLLAEREKSVEREQRLVDQARRAGEEETRRGRDRLRIERDGFEEERQARTAEIQRQHDILEVHAKKLEERRKRLDELRTDLEETHRSTLETRLAIEEELAQLNRAVGGGDEARTRIDRAREALAEHYRHVREALNAQQQEIDEARVAHRHQKDEFRAERQTMTEWVAERDAALVVREDRLHREEDEFAAGESVWQQARERWLREKIAAEEVIRDLLRQLTEYTAEGTGSLADPENRTFRPAA